MGQTGFLIRQRGHFQTVSPAKRLGNTIDVFQWGPDGGLNIWLTGGAALLFDICSGGGRAADGSQSADGGNCAQRYQDKQGPVTEALLEP